MGMFDDMIARAKVKKARELAEKRRQGGTASLLLASHLGGKHLQDPDAPFGKNRTMTRADIEKRGSGDSVGKGRWITVRGRRVFIPEGYEGDVKNLFKGKKR